MEQKKTNTKNTKKTLINDNELIFYNYIFTNTFK